MRPMLSDGRFARFEASGVDPSDGHWGLSPLDHLAVPLVARTGTRVSGKAQGAVGQTRGSS
jgi:hypothetical protein